MLCNAMEHKQQLSHQTARAGMDDLADSTTTTAYIGSLKQQNQGYSRIAQKQSNVRLLISNSTHTTTLNGTLKPFYFFNMQYDITMLHKQ